MSSIVDFTRKIKAYLECIAPIEPTTTASTTHNIGDIFYVNGSLVVATANIAVNDALTVGTNIATSSDLATLIKSKAASPTILTQTLTADSTTVTFTNIPTTGNNIIHFYTNKGINHTEIDLATAGQITLTYEAQPTDTTVWCVIQEV